MPRPTPSSLALRMGARARKPDASETRAAEVAELKMLYLGCLIDRAGWRRRMRRLGFDWNEIDEAQQRLRD